MRDPLSKETMQRARQSGGSSSEAIHRSVARALEARQIRGSVAVDLGCGSGGLHPILRQRSEIYVGVDAIRYDGFPSDARFIQADLNATPLPLETGSADLVVAIETIEHLENPRAFFRELRRLAKPGGWVVLSTPNQLSLLSLGTLLFKRRFSAFQDVHYPAHITALLETDLLNMAREAGFQDAQVEYSHEGRIVLTSLKYPQFISRIFPRMCSDTVLLIARAP